MPVVVMLRHEASVSLIADASCLSMTAYSGLLQKKEHLFPNAPFKNI
ncbi:hypothetical protein G6M26_24175 [Agrobacterium tumefaciens]|nr:hypothetical protein [Agrobacterium tumefaciens]NTE21643.1 hypothetical protein [Agrobacterium tumefaciens]